MNCWLVRDARSKVKMGFFTGAGNRGRWPVVPIWRRLQTLSGTSRTISIQNVQATPLHFCDSCYFRTFNTCVCVCFLVVPNISLSVLKPSFLEILVESHIVMIRVRKKLTQLHCDKKSLPGIICWLMVHLCRATAVWNPKIMRWPLNPGIGPSIIKYLKSALYNLT